MLTAVFMVEKHEIGSNVLLSAEAKKSGRKALARQAKAVRSI